MTLKTAINTKTKLRERKLGFVAFLRHPVRKRSGSVLTTPEPARGRPTVRGFSISWLSVCWLRAAAAVAKCWNTSDVRNLGDGFLHNRLVLLRCDASTMVVRLQCTSRQCDDAIFQRLLVQRFLYAMVQTAMHLTVCSVIFVTKNKTRTRIIGRHFQRTRTIVIQKTKTK